MQESGELNKTVVVLTSDHGAHMGPYYLATEMGRFE
jgi:arylsulfatase A-like enzyme